MRPTETAPSEPAPVVPPLAAAPAPDHSLAPREPAPKPDGVKGLVTGMATGLVTSIVVHPLTRVATRIQVSPERVKFFVELRNHPYQGAAVAMPQVVLQNMILFGAMPYFNYAASAVTSNSLAAKCLAASAAGAAVALAMAPVSTVKNRMMASKDKVCAVQIVRNMVANGEIRRFWDGSLVVVMRNGIVFPIMYSVSDTAEDVLKRANVAQGDSSRKIRKFGCGVVAALASSLTVYPLDVISARQKTSPVRISTFQVIRDGMKMGVGNFYRGYWNTAVVANLIRGGLFISVPDLIDDILGPKK